MMKKLTLLAVAAALLAPVPALAAARTVTLAVDNMTCVTCGPVVKKSLASVAGVERVDLSVDKATATVTFDDAKTNAEALVAATTNAGYPSRVRK